MNAVTRPWTLMPNPQSSSSHLVSTEDAEAKIQRCNAKGSFTSRHARMTTLSANDVQSALFGFHCIRIFHTPEKGLLHASLPTSFLKPNKHIEETIGQQ